MDSTCNLEFLGLSLLYTLIIFVNVLLFRRSPRFGKQIIFYKFSIGEAPMTRTQ